MNRITIYYYNNEAIANRGYVDISAYKQKDGTYSYRNRVDINSSKWENFIKNIEKKPKDSSQCFIDFKDGRLYFSFDLSKKVY